MKIVSRGKLKPLCTSCGQRYNLAKALQMADKKKTGVLRCPKCAKKVGNSQS